MVNPTRKKYGKNEQGRDFVVGDLHGCYERLEQFLEYIYFDQAKDRLFSVGDLVDRGPENELCLQLIDEDWFKCVRGNHEDLMNDFYVSGPYGMFWAPNGGTWGVGYKHEMSDEAMYVRDLAQRASELPVMITVERQDGKFFHVIHAELSCTGPLTDADLDDEEKFAEAAFSQSMDGDFITWGRFMFYGLYNKNMDDREIEKFKKTIELHKMGAHFNDQLSHIYSGHTPMRQPTRIKGQTNIDTCAFKSMWPKVLPYGRVTEVPEWAGLTFTEPLTDRFWTANAGGVREVKPLVFE